MKEPYIPSPGNVTSIIPISSLLKRLKGKIC